MNNRIITKGVYAVFKEYAYRVYLLGKEKNDSGIIDRYKEFVHNKYNDPRFDKILENTMSFPYDKELFDYLKVRKLGPDDLENAMNLFDISYELLVDKINEFVTYSYSKAIDKGLISRKYVFELSNVYMDEKFKKTNKNLDF